MIFLHIWYLFIVVIHLLSTIVLLGSNLISVRIWFDCRLSYFPNLFFAVPYITSGLALRCGGPIWSLFCILDDIGVGNEPCLLVRSHLSRLAYGADVEILYDTHHEIWWSWSISRCSCPRFWFEIVGCAPLAFPDNGSSRSSTLSGPPSWSSRRPTSNPWYRFTRRCT